MKHTKKAIKLVSELLEFYFDSGAENVDINIQHSQKETIISVTGITKNITEQKLQDVKKMLNIPREMQVEGYYWELMGETLHSQELSLVGMVIDSADIRYENNCLQIKIFRKDPG